MFWLTITRLVSYVAPLLSGLLYTVVLAPVIMTLASMIAVIFAVLLHSPSGRVRHTIHIYVALVRSIPELVHIYIWYEALAIVGLVLPAVIAGIAALAVAYGAFLGEVFRGGVLAIEVTQWEAGYVLGMPNLMIWRRIVLPQVIRHILPVWTSYYVSMYKATALLGIITVPDLLYRARGVATQNFRVLEVYLIVLLVYYIIGWGSLRIIGLYGNWMRIDLVKNEKGKLPKRFEKIV